MRTMEHPDDRQGLQSPSPPEVTPAFNLEMVSCGHSNGPLSHSPDTETLTFSVRGIPNPPARLRRTHTGLSARLRKEIMSNKFASEKLDMMRAAIQAKMSEIKHAYDSSQKQNRHSVDARAPSTLVVGIICEEGKHRSVAFAEELSRQIILDSWTIQVYHRDLGLIGDNDGSNGDNKDCGRKSKKQRDQERKKGRSSRHKFVRDIPGDDDEALDD